MALSDVDDNADCYYYESSSDEDDSEEEVKIIAARIPSWMAKGNPRANGHCKQAAANASTSKASFTKRDSPIVITSSSDTDEGDDYSDVYIIDELDSEEKENASSRSTSPVPTTAATTTKVVNKKAAPSPNKARKSKDDLPPVTKKKKAEVPPSKLAAIKKQKSSRQQNYYVEESDSDEPTTQDSNDKSITNFTLNTSLQDSSSTSVTPESLEDILRVLPDAPNLWEVLPIDTLGRTPSKGRRQNNKMFCFRCQERGHRAHHCTNPLRRVVCPLCAKEGHTSRTCLSPLCAKCFTCGHTAQYCCHKIPKCPHCHLKGHFKNRCPDIYRRFYLTVKPGEIQRGTPKTPSHCYKCGNSWHKDSTTKCPSTNLPLAHPGIISFDDPTHARMFEDPNPQQQAIERQSSNDKSSALYQKCQLPSNGLKRKFSSSPGPPPFKKKALMAPQRNSYPIEAPLLPRNGFSTTPTMSPLQQKKKKKKQKLKN